MRTRVTRKLYSFVGFLLLAAAGLQAAESSAEHDQRMEWFRQARFGLFLHWGLYSVPAGEWNGNTNYGEWFLEETKMPVSQYEKFASQFNPVKFDANQWVRMAKDAGMKYIVITSKHHDGFGMFRSSLTDWCIKSTPFQRDPLKELSEACRKQGIKFCLYHSIMDWHHPDWGTRRPWNDKAAGSPDMDRFNDYLKGQLRELLTGYGPIGILWFDGQWEKPWTSERGLDLYNYVRGLQPNIIVNNRVGKPADSASGVGFAQRGRIGDYGTPEQEIPAKGFGPGVDWESCMTMNNHWGYNKYDQNWKSSTTLIRNLIDCSSKGGNYLLNVGPTSEGLFPQASVQRLAEIGRWMKVNGEAIYATQASPFEKLPWGRCTQKLSPKGATLYLHVFDWPPGSKLLVPGLRNSVEKAYLLTSKHSSLSTHTSAEGVVINVPATAPDAASSTIVLKIKGMPEVDQPVPRQQPDGTLVLAAGDARLHGEQIRYESGNQRDNIGFWFDPKEWVDWEFDVKKPGKFDVAVEIAAPADASIRVECTDQRLQAAAPITGDYGKFQWVELGQLTIQNPGKGLLSIHAVPDGWHPVNVRSVRLKPASGSK
ncbi:MAG TPA: alpha-L-fucosidase [Verrucomicrobiae bacterium]|nr:alpha-L-fucosidase [Verrucomicrobiae bacterium]